MSQQKLAKCVLNLLMTTGIFLSIFANSFAQNTSKLWGNKFETILSTGFDSNINGTRVSETKDGFVAATQTFEVSRLNSLLMSNFAGNISRTQFFNERDADFVDGGLELNVAFPDDATDVTYWNAKAFINRISRVDLNEGRRLQPTISGAKISGEWLYTPKTGIIGSVNAARFDRSRDMLSSSRLLSLTTGFSHSRRPERRWSAEYGIKFADTDAGSDATHHLLGFRRRGSLSPKVVANTFFGVRRSDFSGFENFSDTGPTVSADVTWISSPRFNVQLGVESDYDFTAAGFAVLNTEATIRFKRDLGRGFHLATDIGTGYSKYERDVDNRSDRYWMLSGELEYAFTQRFFARLSADLIDSNSNVTGNDLNRGIVSLYSGLRY